LYGNARAEDFWDAQARVSGMPVDKVMRSYIEKPGVPLLTFGERPNTGNYPVTQSRFFLDGTVSEPEPNTGWIVPVCLKDGTCEIVPGGSTAVTPAKLDGQAFFYATAGDKGYYRTAYTTAQWATIVANVETGLTSAERIGLLGDRWALMRAGQRTVGEFLDLVLAMKQDPDATVLEIALGKVEAIKTQIATDADRERLNAVVRREFAGAYAALGGPKKHESDDHAELRGVLFEGLGNAKDPAVLAEADRVAKQLFAAQKPSDPMIADEAVALTTVHGDAEMYEKLKRLAENAPDPDLKDASLRELTRFQDPILVIKTLEYAISDGMRSQDSWTMIAVLLERRETQDLAWEFVQQHWAEIERKSTTSSGARIVEAAGAFCTVEKRDSVASFFAAHAVESSERTLAKSIDSINACIHLRAAQEPELRRWLDAHGGS
jgi:aminopeptidase N/puromycin-sensitive aminopeptidase